MNSSFTVETAAFSVPDLIPILFIFMLGACIGSFLNVVVWRLPRIEHSGDEPWYRTLILSMAGLSNPPSQCPKCGHALKWYDNIPILGWIKLRGKCRFCKTPISMRYPIVEAVTAAMFVLYYVLFKYAQLGPCPPVRVAAFIDAFIPVYPHVPMQAPMIALYLFLASALLAASLIDAELFIIPAVIPWVMAGVGIIVHTFIDHPTVAGALNLVRSDGGGASPVTSLAAGGGIGLLVSLGMKRLGWLPISFSEGDPALDVEKQEAEAARQRGEEANFDEGPTYTPAQVRREMRKEMAFLLPPMLLAIALYLLTTRVPALHSAWLRAISPDWMTGFLGAVFGGIVGAFVVWIVRILGSIGFGRQAMGMGDVDLMFGVGAVLGAGAATVAFFIAPFFGIMLALYMLLTGKKRELPYGPYLSLASGFAMLYYCPIADWLAPGLSGLGYYLTDLIGAGSTCLRGW